MNSNNSIKKAYYQWFPVQVTTILISKNLTEDFLNLWLKLAKRWVLDLHTGLMQASIAL